MQRQLRQAGVVLPEDAAADTDQTRSTDAPHTPEAAAAAVSRRVHAQPEEISNVQVCPAEREHVFDGWIGMTPSCHAHHRGHSRDTSVYRGRGGRSRTSERRLDHVDEPQVGQQPVMVERGEMRPRSLTIV
jgi:hypothetical protein